MVTKVKGSTLGDKGFKTVSDMDLSQSLKVGDFVTVQDYATGNNSGVLYFKIVAAGTGVADGGSFINLSASGLQAQQIFGDTISVKQFGAVGDGVTNDLASFQNTVNYTQDGEIVVISVLDSNYLGDFATLTLGTRNVVWLESGNVSYVTSKPQGNRINSAYNGDKTRPWFVGKNGFITDDTSGTSTDRPTIRVQRVANHTGGVVTANASAISAQTTINQTAGRVDNFENAIVGQVDSYRNDTVTGAPNIAVYQGTCFKHNPSTGGFFGANFVARDQTKRASTVSRGGLVGCEVDVVCSGPDDNGLRIGLDVIARGYDSSVDGATSVHSGVLVRPANSGVLSAEPVKIENAVNVTKGALGSISNCFTADGGGTGLLLVGTYTNAAIETSTSTLSVLKLGSQVKTAGTSHSLLIFSGYNSSDAKKNYTKIQSVVQVNTAGAENGRLDLIFSGAGSDITGFQLSGNSSSNPVFLRVNGSLKQVTEGAVDSGGAGFKVLRVPN